MSGRRRRVMKETGLVGLFRATHLRERKWRGGERGKKYRWVLEKKEKGIFYGGCDRIIG